MNGAFRRAKGGRVDRAKPISFHLRRQAVRRLRRRHARFGAHRQRRPSPRAIVQVSPSARHPVARRRRSQRDRRARRRQGPRHAQSARDADRALRGPARDEPERLAFARMGRAGGRTACSPRSCPPASTTRPSCSRRARGRRLRAVHPPGGGHGARPRIPIPIITHSNTPIATSRWSAADPAGLAAALTASRAGARVMLFDEQAEFGGSLLAETKRDDRRRRRGRLARRDARRTRRRAAREDAAAHADLRLYAQNFLAGQQRLTDHLAAPDPEDAARAAVAGARAPSGRAGDRRARASAGVSRQRPTGDHARRGRAHAREALRRQAGGAHRRRDRARFGLSRRARSRRGGRARSR